MVASTCSSMASWSTSGEIVATTTKPSSDSNLPAASSACGVASSIAASRPWASTSSSEGWGWAAICCSTAAVTCSCAMCAGTPWATRAFTCAAISCSICALASACALAYSSRAACSPCLAASSRIVAFKLSGETALTPSIFWRSVTSCWVGSVSAAASETFETTAVTAVSSSSARMSETF